MVTGDIEVLSVMGGGEALRKGVCGGKSMEGCGIQNVTCTVPSTKGASRVSRSSAPWP